jgi:hypothetical protein
MISPFEKKPHEFRDMHLFKKSMATPTAPFLSGEHNFQAIAKPIDKVVLNYEGSVRTTSLESLRSGRQTISEERKRVMSSISPRNVEQAAQKCLIPKPSSKTSSAVGSFVNSPDMSMKTHSRIQQRHHYNEFLMKQ